MIATKKKEILRIFNFVGQEEANSFQALFPSIHIITKEEVVGVRRESTVLKQSHQICVLTMNITCEFQECQMRQPYFERSKS